MQISTRGRYAVMAMVDLASRQATEPNRGPICLAEIAARQQLSQPYLEQLFGKLRRADLVCSARGPGGGYRLARPPEVITIAEIVAAVDEPMQATRCSTGSGGRLAVLASAGETAPDGKICRVAIGTKCQTHDLWFELGRQIALFLSGITLADIVVGRVAGRAVGLPPQARHPQPANQRQEAD